MEGIETGGKCNIHEIGVIKKKKSNRQCIVTKWKEKEQKKEKKTECFSQEELV